MTPEEKAKKLISINEIIVLAETGHKLSEDERKGIAKRQAINYCNEVFEYMSTRGRDFFMEVKQELEKL
jgi:hypothetical protein